MIDSRVIIDMPARKNCWDGEICCISRGASQTDPYQGAFRFRKKEVRGLVDFLKERKPAG